MISRDDMMLIAAALRRTRPWLTEYAAHTAWMDVRAEIDEVLVKSCPTFDRTRFHTLTEIADHRGWEVAMNEAKAS